MMSLLHKTLIVFRSWLRGKIFVSLREREIGSFRFACFVLSGEYKKYLLNCFGLAARGYDINNDQFVWVYFEQKWSSPTTQEIVAENHKYEHQGMPKKYPEVLGYIVTPAKSLGVPTS